MVILLSSFFSFSSPFFTAEADFILVILAAGFAMAAALAAATLSAAAEGFSGVLLLAARLMVAEAEAALLLEVPANRPLEVAEAVFA